MLSAGLAQAQTDVIPMGTIKYDPAKAWNSFVVLAGPYPKVIDRNGNLVKEWDNKGAPAQPSKIYPGGHILTTMYPLLSTGFQDQNTVAILDFDGKIVRQFNKNQQVSKGEKDQPAEADGSYWMARQHHDFQLEGSPTGYYAPGATAKLDGKMMILAHKNAQNKRINNDTLLDDVILILDKDNKVIWEWKANEHFNQFGFTQPAINKIRAMNASGKGEHAGVDWLHMNCVSWLGPNKWYDAGDKRFHPDNIIADSRNSSHLFIIDHESGDIVWQVAPPFVGEDGWLGPITGVHSTHMIPKGLPGEGNIMLFDNGGPLPDDLYADTQAHAWSRVVEFNPVSKEKVWEYSANIAKISPSQGGYLFFYSPYISNCQRLPNGNTYITEGAANRMFEVTPTGEIVWEYRNPYAFNPGAGYSSTYRSYAVPYDFIPQLQKPEEVSVTAPTQPTSFIMLPNDKGKMPHITPTIDKRPVVQFSEPWVVTRPASK